MLSANYLQGRVDARLHPTGHQGNQIGALDMGEDLVSKVAALGERLVVLGHRSQEAKSMLDSQRALELSRRVPQTRVSRQESNTYASRLRLC